jgi:hypothetical protein
VVVGQMMSTVGRVQKMMMWAAMMEKKMVRAAMEKTMMRAVMEKMMPVEV